VPQATSVGAAGISAGLMQVAGRRASRRRRYRRIGARHV
jgi:hypothetical protein